MLHALTGCPHGCHHLSRTRVAFNSYMCIGHIVCMTSACSIRNLEAGPNEDKVMNTETSSFGLNKVHNAQHEWDRKSAPWRTSWSLRGVGSPEVPGSAPRRRFSYILLIFL